jgi:hypothetical protein
MMGIPVLFGTLLSIVVFDPTATLLFAKGSSAAGLALGLWTAQGAFRRTRNWLIFWLCPEHDPEFRRRAKRQAVAKGVMVAMLILTLFWIVVIGAVLVDDRPGSAIGRLAEAAAAPILLAVAIVVHRRANRRARQFLGLEPRLSPDRFHSDQCALTLACDNPDFAQAVRDAHAAAAD